MPHYADETTEARITHARKEIEPLISQYIKSNNNKGFSNLTKQQKSGLKHLRKRVKKKEIVNYTTDKSRRICTPRKITLRVCKFISKILKNKLAKAGASGDPIATPSIWSYIFPLN